MNKRWICLILTVVMLVGMVPMVKAEAAGITSFNGTYNQVKGFVWEADNNTITFNSDGIFTINVNMYEGYYKLSGTYSVQDNQAFCTLTESNEFAGFNFTMTDINGNLAFEAKDKLVSIRSGAIFKNINASVAPKSPWEDAYMKILKALKDEYSRYNFSLYDVDEDGTPELFLASYGFYTIYTYKDGKVVNLGTVNHHLFMWDEKNSFITVGGLGAGASGAMMYKIENGQLSEGEIVFYSEQPENAQSGTYLINGRTVTEDVYQAESKSYINSSRSIYALYLYYSYNIPDGTRLADYVTARNDSIQVLLDGNKIAFDQPPILDNGRTLVPLRAIFEALGATVNWNESSKTVTATKDSSVIVMKIGEKNIGVNGKIIALDVPPKLVNGRTLVPVRAVAEGFNAGVDWDGGTKTVYLSSNFNDLTVNNIVKNNAYAIFSSPISSDGRKEWEFNYKDDLNMTEQEYRDYVKMASLGAALISTGDGLFDLAKLVGDKKKQCLESAITSLLVPSEDELKTIIQKNLESITAVQTISQDAISISNDLTEMYKVVHPELSTDKLLKDVGGVKTDYGLSFTLGAVNDTITELILLKTIADTYNIIGENYEQFITQLESSSTVTADKDLIISLSKDIIARYKASTKDQIVAAMSKAVVDNAIKDAIKVFITNGLSADKMQSLKGMLFLVIFKYAAKDFIEASNSWLSFLGMNSIQMLAASEYQTLLSQAKTEKLPLTAEIQEKLKNSALVYIMSSIKCRDLLMTTVEKSHPTNNDVEALKFNLESRNDLSYKVFNTWKNAQII